MIGRRTLMGAAAAALILPATAATPPTLEQVRAVIKASSHKILFKSKDEGKKIIEEAVLATGAEDVLVEAASGQHVDFDIAVQLEKGGAFHYMPLVFDTHLKARP